MLKIYENCFKTLFGVQLWGGGGLQVRKALRPGMVTAARHFDLQKYISDIFWNSWLFIQLRSVERWLVMTPHMLRSISIVLRNQGILKKGFCLDYMCFLYFPQVESDFRGVPWTRSSMVLFGVWGRNPWHPNSNGILCHWSAWIEVVSIFAMLSCPT